MAGSKKQPKGEPKRDEAREDRIAMEIVVDAHDSGERAVGWYCYLENELDTPFTARCVSERAVSPLRVGDEVTVVGMAPSEECGREMFVETSWEGGRTLAVPLSQLEVVRADKTTRRAVEDWRYWTVMGYEF